MPTLLLTANQAKEVHKILNDHHFNTVHLAQKEQYGKLDISVFGMQGTGVIAIAPDGTTTGS